MEVGSVLLALAVFAVAGLPVLLAVALCSDEIADRVVCGYVEWRDRRRERRVIARLDQAVEADSITRDVDLSALDRPDRRPLEQLAADLRWLGNHRIAAGGRVRIWHDGVLQAYDERLRLACRALGITEHLTDLAGVDREIERVRVEGLLHGAGLTLPAAWASHHNRHR